MQLRQFLTSLLLLQSSATFAQNSAVTQINPAAQIVAKTETFIPAAPETIWQVLTDVDHWPDWVPELVPARLDGPLAAGTTLYWKPMGQDVVSRMVIVDRPKRLVWNGSGGAVHIWELISQKGGTLLKNSESIESWNYPNQKGDQSAFLTHTLNLWNARLFERSVAKEAEAEARSGPD